MGPYRLAAPRGYILSDNETRSFSNEIKNNPAGLSGGLLRSTKDADGAPVRAHHPRRMLKLATVYDVGAAMTARPFFVLLHRWAGLVMAGFLLIAGLTGSLLAWNDELEAAISPQLFRAASPATGDEPLDPLVVRERVQAAYPGTFVAFAPLSVKPEQALVYSLHALPDPATGATPELPNNQVFVNPYTGQVLGERQWGDISQGLKNLMPFIYRLHYTLALDVVGSYTFGIIALLWTLDCFVGACLTFPAPVRGTPTGTLARAAITRGKGGKSWLTRWWLSWKVRWAGGSYKLNFDLHRAGGLWVWAMLFVLAWSGVAFNLSEVYDPVMKSLFTHQAGRDDAAPLAKPLLAPPVDWREARAIGREHMAEQARAQGFSVRQETMLRYDPRTGIYRYNARTSRDVSEHWGLTSLNIDGRGGEVSGLWLPTGAASGDTIRTWITTLHMAALWGIPMKLFVCGMGLVVAMLSVTGVIIWRRKRAARHQSVARKAGAPTRRGQVRSEQALSKQGALAPLPQTKPHRRLARK